VDARLGLWLVAALLVGSLVSCGSKDKPAVCGSVDDLSSSVEAITSTTVASPSGASALTAVAADLDAVKAEAQTQFAPQITAATAALSALQASTAIAKAKPTPASLAASAKDFSTFGSAVQTLVADIKSTC
jgi:hypothetical protein